LVKGLFVLLLSAHALFGQTFVALGPDPSSIELGASSRVRLQLAGDGLPGVLSSMEVIRLDYVTTARAKGVRESAVVLKHALKNALIPTVTVLGLQIGFLIGGAIVVETVFAVPGVGSFGIAAISLRDYPQVQAFVLLFAVGFVLTNLIVDILYAFLDPRIKYGTATS
jgi:ABC-type microcin C transport system permease subunit YejB